MKKYNLPHSKTACPYRPKEIRPSIKLIQEILTKEESNIPLVTFTNEYKYVFLSRGQNKKLFALLDTSGFWDFHCSNTKKRMCSLHQIVLYVWCGWNLFLQGYTCNSHECEIHHLDHDPSNNNLDNLVYVTSQENKLLSDICRFTYNGWVKSSSINPFGNKPKKSAKQRIIKLIKATISKTFARLGLTAPTETSFAWLLSLPQKLGQEIIYTWQYLPHNTKLFIDNIFYEKENTIRSF